MKTKTRDCDVFLSYALEDRPVAQKIARTLTQVDLEVFDPSQLAAGRSVWDEIRQAIARSDAIVVILPEDGTLNPNMAIEVGAAMAWRKPVYLIRFTNGQTPIPNLFEQSTIYPLSRIDDVARDIQRKRTTPALPDEHRVLLQRLYLEMGVPADRFIGTPELLEELASRFEDEANMSVPGEKLLSEIIRLRKQGHLPKLKRPTTPSSAS